MRLKREIAAAARENRPRPVRDEAAIARRVREVGGAVRRLIYNEYERSDAETCDELVENLEEILLSDSRCDDFAAPELDEHVVALSHTLDLPLAKARLWRDLPDPDAPAEPPEPESDWRGSG